MIVSICTIAIFQINRELCYLVFYRDTERCSVPADFWPFLSREIDTARTNCIAPAAPDSATQAAPNQQAAPNGDPWRWRPTPTPPLSVPLSTLILIPPAIQTPPGTLSHSHSRKFTESGNSKFQALVCYFALRNLSDCGQFTGLQKFVTFCEKPM